MKTLMVFLCLALPCLVSSGKLMAQAADREGGAAENPPMAAAVVLGVINFTRWPQLGSAIRACLLGESENHASIRQLSPATQKMMGLPANFLTPVNDEKIARQCDLVYAGEMPENEIKTLIKNISNAPVLSIGEDRAFCSLGGMFCLNARPEAGSAGFAVNLDSISRSKLRINPQVLRLTSQLGKALP